MAARAASAWSSRAVGRDHRALAASLRAKAALLGGHAAPSDCLVLP
jgi:hypothetical protein